MRKIIIELMEEIKKCPHCGKNIKIDNMVKINGQEY